MRDLKCMCIRSDPNAIPEVDFYTSSYVWSYIAVLMIIGHHRMHLFNAC